MSFSLTTTQVQARTKTVTRRMGWALLRNGTLLQACVKCMGLKHGEKIKKLAVLVVGNVSREALQTLIDDPIYGQAECAREGFPKMAPAEFVAMFCESHKGCTPAAAMTRAPFSYRDEVTK